MSLSDMRAVMRTAVKTHNAGIVEGSDGLFDIYHAVGRAALMVSKASISHSSMSINDNVVPDSFMYDVLSTLIFSFCALRLSKFADRISKKAVTKMAEGMLAAILVAKDSKAAWNIILLTNGYWLREEQTIVLQVNNNE